MKMSMTPLAEALMQGGSTDKRFVKAMKAHHEDAVKMASDYLRTGTDPMLRNIAENIVKSQSTEIRKFDLWTKRKENQS